MLRHTWTPEHGVLPQVQMSSSGPEAEQEAAAASARCQPVALALMAQAQWAGAAWDSRVAARPQARCTQAALGPLLELGVWAAARDHQDAPACRVL